MVRRPIPNWLLASFALVLAGGATAQTTDDVSREVQRLRVQIDQERRSISQDSAQQALWRSQSRARMAAMRSEAVRLGKDRDSLRLALERSSQPKAPVAPPVAPATARKQAFAEALAREIDKTTPLLSLEMDGGAELREQWGRLSRGLRAGTEDPSEALGRFLDDLSERIDMGSRVASHPGTHTDAAGKAVRGVYLDVGQNLQVFVGNDGEMAALRTRGETGLHEVTAPAERSALARAAQMVAGQQMPSWAFLPVAGGVK